MVAQQLSRGIIPNPDDARVFHSESATSALSEQASFNMDRRTVAIGGNEELWLNDLLSGATTTWFSMLRSMNDSLELMVATKKPTKILSLTPGIGAGMYEWINENPTAKLTLINSPQLDVYEQHMMATSEVFTVANYDVIDFDDLETAACGQFDFIVVAAYDIVSDPEVQKWAVDALESGGLLYVALANNGGKLYRDDYHSHPYADLHQFLISCDGLTYHVPAHYGYTVFIKN